MHNILSRIDFIEQGERVPAQSPIVGVQPVADAQVGIHAPIFKHNLLVKSKSYRKRDSIWLPVPSQVVQGPQAALQHLPREQTTKRE